MMMKKKPYQRTNHKKSHQHENNKSNVEIPKSLMDQIQLKGQLNTQSQDIDDSRFKFRGYKASTLNRKEERKRKRMEKKQSRNHHHHQDHKKQQMNIKNQGKNKKLKIANAAEKDTDKVQGQTIHEKVKVDSRKLSQKSLTKFAKMNPELYSLLNAQNLISADDSDADYKDRNIVLAQDGQYQFTQKDFEDDDKLIQLYAKKLGIKKKNKNKLPKGLVDDGLGDLFDDLELTLNDIGDGVDDQEHDLGIDNIELPDGESFSEIDSLDNDDDDSLEDIYSYQENDDNESELNDGEDQEQETQTSDDENEISPDENISVSELTDEEETNSDAEYFESSENNHNFVDESGETTTATSTSTSKYIPPHLRAKMLKVVPDSERIVKLKKQLQGLLNKISEGNIGSIILSLEDVLVNSSRRDFIETLTELLLNATADPQLQLPDNFAQLHAAFIMAVSQVIAGQEFAANFLESLFLKVQSNRKEWNQLHEEFSKKEVLSQDEEESLTNKSKTCTNLITLLSYLYTFDLVACMLVYDIVRICVEDLNDLHVEMLLRLLRICGQRLRSDDPSALKDIIIAVQNATSNLDQCRLSSRCKFMIETITDLKNNKKKVKGAAGGLVAGPANNVNMERLKKFLNNLGKKRTLKVIEPLRVTMKDFEESDSKGKWWLVGAAWAGREGAQSNDRQLQKIDDNISRNGDQSDLLQKRLIDLARSQGMNTDIRRSIFVILMSSEDCVDAYEKLMRLNLKDKQEREIVRVILHCCGQEQVFNPYYAFVGQKFCEYSYSFKVTFQFAYWDFLKELSQPQDLNGSLIRKISHLSKTLGALIKRGALSLTILRILNFTALTKPETLFNQILFLYLFSCQGKDRHLVLRKTTLIFQQSFHLSAFSTIDSANAVSKKKKREMKMNNETLSEGIAFFIDQYILKPLTSDSQSMKNASASFKSLIPSLDNEEDIVFIARYMKEFLVNRTKK